MGIGGVSVLFVVIVVFGGYYFEWKWTGYPKRTPWDWVDLLIVPFVLALGGYLFTRSENQRAHQIAEQRSQDDALQAYLSQIGELLLREQRPLHETKKCDVVRTLAWARTKTVLRRLHDGAHKGRVLRFLGEARLVNKPAPVIDLKGADLREADLRGSVLEE